jgi:hypothetical protein
LMPAGKEAGTNGCAVSLLHCGASIPVLGASILHCCGASIPAAVEHGKPDPGQYRLVPHKQNAYVTDILKCCRHAL